MANIINLNDLVPGLEGKTFQITQADGETKSYHVPGDLDSETVFEFLKLFEDMVEFQTRANELRANAGDDPELNAEAVTEVMTALRRLNDQVKAKLLAVFKIANPELEALPFGSATTMVVLGEILEMMGLAAPNAELPLPEGGGANPPNRAQRRTARKKTTSSSTSKAGARRSRTAA